MNIIWSDFASETLREIHKYYREHAGEPIARRIKTNIFAATRQLLKHPQSGQIEKTLEQLNEGHRYLVEGNYKIVYKLVTEGVLITDVFDTRQDPKKINDKNRKTSGY